MMVALIISAEHIMVLKSGFEEIAWPGVSKGYVVRRHLTHWEMIRNSVGFRVCLCRLAYTYVSTELRAENVMIVVSTYKQPRRSITW